MAFRLRLVLNSAVISAALQISDLTISLGGNEILSGVNATINEGEFVGIFGPNGAGKTTLVRAIIGTLAPTRGQIRVLGLAPRDAGRQIGYMPQGHGGFDATALSARALVEAACDGDRWGIPWTSKKSRQEVERVLEVTDAASYANRPFSVLSGGERQRVMLAQAILGNPRLLVLDEPLASLDPKNQALLIECVARVKRLTKTTILFVAHDMNPLLQVMDRVLYMAGGGAVLGKLDEVVTSASLSRLYGFKIEVVRVENRVFVMAAEGNVTESEYAHHDHDHDHD
jgi:zinc/manganese transport system ATP-binding protein